MGSVPEADPADLNGSSLANSTFSLVGEDHTLGNAARYVLNQEYNNFSCYQSLTCLSQCFSRYDRKSVRFSL